MSSPLLFMDEEVEEFSNFFWANLSVKYSSAISPSSSNKFSNSSLTWKWSWVCTINQHLSLIVMDPTLLQLGILRIQIIKISMVIQA